MKQPITPSMFRESEAPKPKLSPTKVALGIVAVFVLIVLAQFSPWVQDAQAKNRAQSIAREGVR